MSESLIFEGRVWLFGDNVDTDQILPGFAMSYPRERLKECVMRGSLIPDFAARVKPGDIVVAGRNFGAGSSREQAAIALKDAGVSIIIATSFARIFRRNSINIGLPVLVADIFEKVNQGQCISVNVLKGEVYLPDGMVVHGKIPGGSVLEILIAGGLIPKVRQQLALNRRNS